MKELIFRDVENEIVFVNNDKVFAESRTIAAKFNRRHDHILNLIDGAIGDISKTGFTGTIPTFGERKYKTSQGNTYIYYELDRKAFMFLMMKMKGAKADLFKLEFIEAFDNMEQWIKDRAVGRGVRLSMTDSIKNYLPESPNKKFKYKHFTDLVYKKVLSKNSKQIKEQFGEFDSLRDICTENQLKEIQDIENEISVLLKYGLDYSAIKEHLNK